jgi:isopentenyldiphosphate isomerase
MNSSGELLCHKRSYKKERLPGGWSTHLGGHVGVDESYEMNAQKELEEEAGIWIKPEQLIQWRTTKLEKSRLWVREYVILVDQPETYFVPQAGEVEQFKWMSLQDIVRSAEGNRDQWFAGTHDLRTEYEAMRAALVVAHTLGACHVPTEMHSWQPLSVTV